MRQARSKKGSRLTVHTLPYRPATNGLPEALADVVVGEHTASNAPVVVFLHGGGLMLGDRTINLNPSSLAHYLVQEGCVVVSIDYRLAPVHRLQDAVQDVEDACRWVEQEAGKKFYGDGTRLAVIGESAGAYLSLVVGQNRDLATKCIASLWGYGDITGRWYSEPSSYFLKWEKVSREQAFANRGVDLYVYARQTGSWTQIVTRLDPVAQQEEVLRYCPRFNVTKEYPATLLVAGKADKDVPFEESVLMANAFTLAGVPHELVGVMKGGHGFEETPPAERELIYEKVAFFVNTYCRA